MPVSLEQIEMTRKELQDLLAEQNGNFLHPSVIKVSRKLDQLITDYLKSTGKERPHPNSK